MGDARPIIILAEQSALAASLPEDISWLSASETARLRRISSPARQHEFLAARKALRMALALARPERSWRDAVLSAEDGRAPTVESGPAGPLHLSLSHSGGLIAAAVSAASIGIDLELQRKPRPVAELLELVGSPSERQSISQLPLEAQTAAFYRLWTLKEAYFKYQGSGLDWAIIRRLSTREHAHTHAHAFGSVWEGSHDGFPYTMAVCRGVMNHPSVAIPHTLLPAPAFQSFWIYDL